MFQTWKATRDNYTPFALFSSMNHLKKKIPFFIYSAHYVGKHKNWRTFESTFTCVTQLISLSCDISGMPKLAYSVTLRKFCKFAKIKLKGLWYCNSTIAVKQGFARSQWCYILIKRRPPWLLLRNFLIRSQASGFT